MAVYLSALPATRSDQAQSRAYKILLYIPELSPAECRPGFPFQQFVQKKTHTGQRISPRRAMRLEMLIRVIAESIII